jgi:Brp/Blh family beta-carotene 15,15'-monooxygenase
VAELLLTTAIFAVFHPLAAFLLYFCFVHSVRHIADLGAARFPDAAPRALRWLLVESLPFTLATVVLGGLAWFVFGRAINFDEAMIRLVFWGLSALTLPHMILTAWWHGRGDPRPGDLFARHV